jgi:hypothetical protein
MHDLERIMKAMGNSADPAVNEAPIVQELRVVVQEEVLQSFLNVKASYHS